MKSAPHLPPKTCGIDTHQRLQNIKWILLFGFFAFIAGGSAALMFNAWLVPNYSLTPLWTANSVDRTLNKIQPDPLLERQMRQRLLAIHDKRKKPGGEFYTRGSFIANAAIISSDGWAVVMVPNYAAGQEKNWEIVDYQRVAYKLEKTAYDKLESLLYFKVKGEGLRVVSFPQWPNVEVGISLWSAGFSGWQQTYIKEKIKTTDKNLFNIWSPQYSFSLGDNVSFGDLLFNDKGELAAAAGEDNIISHGWLIEAQTKSLLSSGKLSYQGLPWQGYFVQGAGQEQVIKVVGFYVEKSPTAVFADAVGNGDVILKINGETVNEQRLAEQIWLAPSEFKVLVWREGKELEVKVNKTAVQP